MTAIATGEFGGTGNDPALNEATFAQDDSPIVAKAKIREPTVILRLAIERNSLRL